MNDESLAEKTMPDIIELLAASHLHIMIWQTQLAELRHQREPASLPAIATTWDTIVSLIDLHMAADQEICVPAMCATGTRDVGRSQEVADDYQDIRGIIRETWRYPPGSPAWWHLATAALSAWTRHLHCEVYGPVGEMRRLADPELRVRLGWQWRCYLDAQIRGRYPHAPAGVPTCELQAQPAPAVPRLAAPAFGPLSCACPDCTAELELSSWTVLSAESAAVPSGNGWQAGRQARVRG